MLNVIVYVKKIAFSSVIVTAFAHFSGSLGKTASTDSNFGILEQYERQLTDSGLRVPINVLRTGEKTLRQELSETNKPYGEIF